MTIRRFILFALTVFVSTTLHAQFILTPEGFITEEGKDYYVLHVDGMNQQDLFNAVYIWAGGSFVSPKDVVSSNSNSTITINAIVPGLTKMPKRAIRVPVDVNFSWQILFKDGRIRFNAPHINSMEADGNLSQSLSLVRSSAFSDGIFKKNGSLVDEYSKNQLEAFFTNCIKNIEENLMDEEW